jgi:hypothetical protein
MDDQIIGNDVAYMGQVRNAYKILVRKPKGRNLLEDLDIEGRIILKSLLNMQSVRI